MVTKLIDDFSLLRPLSSPFLQLFKDKRKPSPQEIEYIRSCCQLIEVIYDPYLTWRNFLHAHFADHRYIQTTIVQLHVELVPFIYGIFTFVLGVLHYVYQHRLDLSLCLYSSDCFQFETIIHLPEIGVPLVHMLGAIISGSQVIHFVSIIFHVFFSLFLLVVVVPLLRTYLFGFTQVKL